MEPIPDALQRQVDAWLTEMAIEKRAERIPGFEPPPRRARPKPTLPPMTPRPPDLRPRGTLARLLYDSAPVPPFTREPEQWSADWATARAAEWVELMFDVEDVTAWLNAGLRPVESELAHELRAAGISPAMMSMTIRGDSIIYRLRNSQFSIRQLADLLRREGVLSDSSGSASF